MQIRPHRSPDRYEARVGFLAGATSRSLPETLPPRCAQVQLARSHFLYRSAVGRSRLERNGYLPGPGVERPTICAAEFVMMWRDLLGKPAARRESVRTRPMVLRDFHSRPPNLTGRERQDLRDGVFRLPDAYSSLPPMIWCRCCRMRRIDFRNARLSSFDAHIKARARGTDDTLRSGPPFADLYAIIRRRQARVCSPFALLNRRDGNRISAPSARSGPSSAFRCLTPRWRAPGECIRQLPPPVSLITNC